MKTAQFLLLAAILWGSRDCAFAQNWAPSGAMSNHWQSIASSADGRQLVAGCLEGPIFISTNSGDTWIQNTNAPIEVWSSIASSADGTKLVAAAGNGGVFTSTNSGADWNMTDLPAGLNWQSVVITGDGTRLAASAFFARGSATVYTSTNSGDSWIPSNAHGASLACSADGSRLYLASCPQVWCSTDFGVTWDQLTNAPFIPGMVSLAQIIASSADGNRLVLAAIGLNQIYVSPDAGVSWYLTGAPTNYAWTFVASSADGKTLLATPGGPIGSGPIGISTDGGITWTTNGSPSMIWGAVASSADGGAVLASGSFDNNYTNASPIYVSQTVQPPFMNIIQTNGGVGLSWLVPSTNFALQQSPDLQNWSALTNQPVLNLTNLNNEVTLPMTNGNGFFRLATPSTNQP